MGLNSPQLEQSKREPSAFKVLGFSFSSSPSLWVSASAGAHTLSQSRVRMSRNRPPLRRCNHALCREKIREGRFCQKHDYRRAGVQEKQKDRERGSSSQRGYGANWRRIRDVIMAERGICESCRAGPATDVHHLIKKADGGLDTRENLVALCHSCHSKETARGR